MDEALQRLMRPPAALAAAPPLVAGGFLEAQRMGGLRPGVAAARTVDPATLDDEILARWGKEEVTEDAPTASAAHSSPGSKPTTTRSGLMKSSTAVPSRRNSGHET